MPLLRLIPDRHLTHHLEMDLPSGAGALTYVTARRRIDGAVIDAPIHLAIHVPDEGRALAVRDGGAAVHPC